MEPTEGTVVAGKYRLELPIARGGMGTVWAARHEHVGSRVAIKFVDPGYARDPAFLARFEREARATAAIQSPHVVYVQDFGVEDGTPYLVMELLHGEDLGMRLRRVRRLSIPDAARIVVQMGRALRRAHEAGVIHRDLKPANLFLARVDDEDEMVKVLDFGIAKQAGTLIGENTRTGEVMGSPHYMAPEQARADKGVDHRSDLWSMGVIVYRMLTGRLPFEGEVLGAVMARLLVDPAPPMAEVAPDLPPALDGFFAKALAKRREDRFQTSRELVDAFLAVIEQRHELPTDMRASMIDPVSGRVVESFPRPPQPSIPAPPAFAASDPPPASITGPSIATTVSNVRSDVPGPPPRRKAPLFAAIAAAVGLGVLGLVLLMRGPEAAPAAAGADSASESEPGSTVSRPSSPVVTPAPVVLPAPSATASESAPVTAPESAPAPESASATATPESTGAPAPPASSVPPASSAAASSTAAAPSKSGAPKATWPAVKGTKKRDDWGF